LTNGIVKPFDVVRLSSLFADRFVLFIGDNCRIRFPEVGITRSCTILARNGIPEFATRFLITAANDKGNNLPRFVAKGQPYLGFVRFLGNK
jgi:hypothetical protein